MDPEVEEAVVKMAFDYPAYGQQRVCNELRMHGIFVSAGGVRSVWQRHDLEVFDKRLKALEARMAQDTYYVGNIKGVGRIYQQTFIDTYSRVAFAKVYDRKNAITAADILNDRGASIL